MMPLEARPCSSSAAAFLSVHKLTFLADTTEQQQVHIPGRATVSKTA